MTNFVNKTLLIDDSDIDLFIQRRFLEVYNFSNELFVYKSAGLALDWLRTIGDEDPPELIFLDLNMPEIDGFTFLQKFNELPQKVISNTRIVVLTSSNSSKDREMAFEHKNVVMFITKPLKPSDLEEIKHIIPATAGKV